MQAEEICRSTSVIIPTWNRKEKLSRSIKSVLAQTVQPLEILICDDGSTDDSRNLIHHFNSPLIKWSTYPHSGHPGSSRNQGLKTARGEWIAFLDDDDMWLPNKLESQAIVIARSGHGACSTNATVQSHSSTAYILHSFDRETIRLYDLYRENIVVCSSMLARKNLIVQCEGFSQVDECSYEDYDLWLRLACLTPISYLADALVIYEDFPETSARRYNARHEDQITLIKKNLYSWSARRNIASAPRILWTEFDARLKGKFSRTFPGRST